MWMWTHVARAYNGKLGPRKMSIAVVVIATVPVEPQSYGLPEIQKCN